MKNMEYSTAVELVKQAMKLSDGQRKALAEERLKELVAYVKIHSPYLAQKYQNLKSDFSLQDLPIMQKEELQNNFDDWVTDREATKAELTAYLESEPQTGKQSLFLNQYTTISTSGSTGQPFIMLRDEYHNMIHGALVNLRFLGETGAEAFSPSQNRIASIIITKPGVSSYASFLRAKQARPEFSHNMTAISITQPLEDIVEQLNAFQPAIITGYPSIIQALAKEQAEGRLKLELSGIACSAEPLTAQASQYIAQAFNCRVLNNYCMTEGGEIAMCKGDCTNLHLNDDWIIVEPIDQEGNPSTPGSYSEAALITDLSNYICPIIRYKVSDRIYLDSHSACQCGSSLPLLHISGRVVECFQLCGKFFSPFGLVDDLQTLDGVIDQQLAKVAPDTIEIRLQIVHTQSFEEVKQAAASIAQHHLELNKCIGAKVIFSQRLGNNNAKTGKRAVVVNEVKDHE